MAQTYDVIYNIKATDNTNGGITTAKNAFNQLKSTIGTVTDTINAVKTAMTELGNVARNAITLNVNTERAVDNLKLFNEEAKKAIALLKQLQNARITMGAGANKGNQQNRRPANMGSGFRSGYYPPSGGKGGGGLTARQMRDITDDYRPPRRNPNGHLPYPGHSQKIQVKEGIGRAGAILKNPSGYSFDPAQMVPGWTDWMKSQLRSGFGKKKYNLPRTFFTEAIARDFQYYDPANATAAMVTYNKNLARMQRVLGGLQYRELDRAERAHNRMRNPSYEANYQKQWDNYLKRIGLSRWEWDNASRVAQEMGMSQRQISTFKNRGWMPYVNPQTSDQVMANQHVQAVRNTLASMALTRDREAYNTALRAQGGTGMIAYDSKKWNEYVRQSQKAESTRAAAANRVRNSNYAYKLIGPTPLTNNGGMAMEMLKGMGLMYGISLVGSLAHDIVEASVDFDNTMKTVENILSAHDTSGNFSSKFSHMSTVIRNVGMETKFKVTEVADAAKFLAMAGLSVDAITHAIRPIADIALVGDTDLGQTADLVTNIMTGYGIRAERMRNAADIMTNTFTMSNTTLTEIAESYKYASTLLKAAGVPFEVATAGIGVLGNAGIKGSQAGTTLRMILNNIAKPTDKQQAAWNRLGVKTKDENGNIRNILEIFEDLNAKGLKLEDYYSLFRVTAAPGAAALAQNVKDWRDITMENYISDGLSKKLADEKKNTIAGLWAQLTSVFTDQGVKAFGGIQGYIRETLQKGIELMGSDRALQILRKFSDSMVQFFNILKDVSEYFIWFYEKFGHMIKVWMQFQLVIWPVTKALTAFRTVFTGLGAIRNFALTMRDAGIAMGFMKNKALEAKAATQALNGATVNPQTQTLLGATKKSRNDWGGKMGKWNAPNWMVNGYNRINPMVETYTAYDTGYKDDKGTPIMAARWEKSGSLLGRFWGNMGRNATGLLGGAILSYGAMSSFTKEDKNEMDNITGGIRTVAATLAALGTFYTPLLVAAGLLGGISLITDHFAEVQRSANAAKELGDMLKSYNIQEGVIIDKNASSTQQWINYVLTGTRDINKELELRIAHMKEIMGLETPYGQDTDVVNTDTAIYYFKQLTKGSGSHLLQDPDALAKINRTLATTGLGLSVQPEGDNVRFYVNDQPGALLDRVGGSYALATIMNALTGSSVTKTSEELSKSFSKYGLADDVAGVMGLIREVSDKYKEAQKQTPEVPFSEFVGKSKEEIEQLIADQKHMGSDNKFHRLLYNAYLYQLYGEGSKFYENVKRYDELRKTPESAEFFPAFMRYYQSIAREGTIMTEPILDKVDDASILKWENAMGWHAGDNMFIPIHPSIHTPLQQAQGVQLWTSRFLKDVEMMHEKDAPNAELQKLLSQVEIMHAISTAFIELSNNGRVPDDIRKVLNQAGGMGIRYYDRTSGQYLLYDPQKNQSAASDPSFYKADQGYILGSDGMIVNKSVADAQTAQEIADKLYNGGKLDLQFNEGLLPTSPIQAGFGIADYAQQAWNSITGWFGGESSSNPYAGVFSQYADGVNYTVSADSFVPGRGFVDQTGIQGVSKAMGDVLIPTMRAEGLAFAETIHDAFRDGVLQALKEWGLDTFGQNSFYDFRLSGYTGIGQTFAHGLNLYGQSVAQSMNNDYAGIFGGPGRSSSTAKAQERMPITVGNITIEKLVNIENANMDTDVDSIAAKAASVFVDALQGSTGATTSNTGFFY